jgi:hypothetical protein
MRSALRGAVALRMVAVLLSLSVGGCEDDCKNPKRIEGPDPVRDNIWRKGSEIKCNLVVICDRKDGKKRTELVGLNDIYFADRGSDTWNKSGCEHAWRRREEALYGGKLPPGYACEAEASPAIVCLDADGAAGGPGPSVGPGGPAAVGVGAAGSGDFPADEDAVDGTEEAAENSAGDEGAI